MPAVFEPNSALTGGSAQIWIAASGGPNWGGCAVLISFDGVNYSYAGNITAPTQQGTLIADFPAYGGGPGAADSTDTLSVDLTMSNGILPTNATSADADAYRTLCVITPSFTTVVPNNGELVAYGAVAQGATENQFLLGTSAINPGAYIRRGLYGTSSPDHPVGSMFTRINLNEDGVLGNSLLIFDLPVAYIGKTIFLKFLSFNTFGNELQDPSAASAYQYTTTGRGYGGGSVGVPTTPTGLAASGIAGGIAFSWSANASTDSVTSYVLERATASGGPYSTVWQGNALTWIDTSAAAGTTYYYQLAAANAAGTSSYTGYVSASALPGSSGAGRRMTASSSPITLLASDIGSSVYITDNTGGALQINLPTSPPVGRISVIYETGSTNSPNWTIKSGASTIDTVVTNPGYSNVSWTGASWVVG